LQATLQAILASHVLTCTSTLAKAVWHGRIRVFVQTEPFVNNLFFF
jgi:hypothetical protein